MSEGKEEIIIDVDNGEEKSNEQNSKKVTKQLAPVTKFFIIIFSALLIYHFVTSWIANRKINALTTEVGELKLENQKLSENLKNLTKVLSETKTNLNFVDTDRLKKSNEINELQTILDSMKKNIPEGSKLLVQRLEKKIKEWEEYQKNLEESLKNRPDK